MFRSLRAYRAQSLLRKSAFVFEKKRFQKRLGNRHCWGIILRNVSEAMYLFAGSLALLKNPVYSLIKKEILPSLSLFPEAAQVWLTALGSKHIIPERFHAVTNDCPLSKCGTILLIS